MYCCDEHIDRAIDEMLDLHPLPPSIENVSDEEQLHLKCHFCDDRPIYCVKNPI